MFFHSEKVTKISKINHKLYLSCHMPIVSFSNEKIKSKQRVKRTFTCLITQFKYATNFINVRNLLVRKVYLNKHPSIFRNK